MSDKNFPIFRRFVWKAIRNCTKDTLMQFEIDECITSQDFEIPIGGEITEWYLDLYPNDPFHMSLYLHRRDYLELKFTVNNALYIIGKSENHCEFLSRCSSDEIKKDGTGNPPFLDHKKFAELFDELVSDGDLTIGCEITISALEHSSTESSAINVYDDIQKMFEDEIFADFELRCNDDVKLKCHKFILAARSPVFWAMLSTDMEEAREGFAEVPDFDSVVMKEVLRFIYSDRVENLDNISKKLIFAAEKYDVQGLKEKCIENTTKNLSKQNVIEVLLITEKVSGCKELFKECAMVIERNIFEISKSRDWEKLSKDMMTKLMIELKTLCTVEIIK